MRRHIFAVLLAISIVMLVGVDFKNVLAQPSGIEKVTLMLDWAVGGKHSPFFVALDKGWYRDEGIEVDIMRGYGPTGMVVDQGKGTFGLTTVVNTALVRSKGGDIKIVGIMLNKQITGFASLAETGIKTPKDMEGRTVATTVGSSAVTMLPIFAKLNGVDLKKIKVIYMDGSVLVQALLKKEVDIATLFKTALWEVLVTIARKQGIKVSLLEFSDWGLDIYETVIIAKEQFLNKNPELTKRFLRASYKGFSYSITHPDEAINILSKRYPEINKDIARLQLDTCLELVQSKDSEKKGLGWVNQEKMKRTLDVVSEAYDMKLGFSPESIYTNEFLPGKF